MNIEKFDTSIKVTFFILLSSVFIISPYNYGLFFDQHTYIWEIIINVLFILFAIYAVYSKQFTIVPILSLLLYICYPKIN